MKKYILAWDEGTTSTRAILFDREAKIMAISQKEFSQLYPEPGWVEQDPMEIWSSQIGVATEVLARANARPEDIAAIGITNQRETTLVWDKKTGQPVYNAIGWQCRRTAPLCTQLEKDGYKDLLQEKTGLILDPYFSATKIRWILDHIEDGQGRAERGELLFGTIDTWLIWRLTDGEVHVTDYSNASRTMLLNIHDLDWDREILDILHIPRVMLPEVRPSSEVYGHSHTRFFGTPIPIGAAVGDQQGALFGQACFTKGDVKSTYGTGAFILLNTGDQAVHSKNGLVTTLAWGLEPGKVTYALEGSIFVSGASIKWLRDQVRMIDSAEDTEYIATKVNSTDGLYVVPAFTGLGAPYWDPNARGLIIGITLGTTKKHIIRATLEAQAYLTNDVLESMIDDAQIAINEIKVDGGASRNNFMMQSLADISRVRVERPQTLESSALGAAFLAGLAVGFWSGLDELEKMWDVDRVYDCRMNEKNRDRKLRNWHQAVKRARNWAEDYEPWEE